jgi:translation elongation factor EF-1alpha
MRVADNEIDRKTLRKRTAMASNLGRNSMEFPEVLLWIDQVSAFVL